jgi:hypothetical protein
LAIYTGARMKDDPLKERQQTANELADYVAKKKPKTLDDFLAIGREKEWKSRHVVANRLLQSPDKPLSKKIGEEIAKLHSVGQTTPLLTDEDGLRVLHRALHRRAPSRERHVRAGQVKASGGLLRPLAASAILGSDQPVDPAAPHRGLLRSVDQERLRALSPAGNRALETLTLTELGLAETRQIGWQRGQVGKVLVRMKLLGTGCSVLGR